MFLHPPQPAVRAAFASTQFCPGRQLGRLLVSVAGIVWAYGTSLALFAVILVTRPRRRLRGAGSDGGGPTSSASSGLGSLLGSAIRLAIGGVLVPPLAVASWPTPRIAMSCPIAGALVVTLLCHGSPRPSALPDRPTCRLAARARSETVSVVTGVDQWRSRPAMPMTDSRGGLRLSTWSEHHPARTHRPSVVPGSTTANAGPRSGRCIRRRKEPPSHPCHEADMGMLLKERRTGHRLLSVPTSQPGG